MDERVWSFERAGDRLEIRRTATDRGVQLSIHRGGESHDYSFAELTDAITFQSDMESMLIGTGWSFVRFSPDRRTGIDRRTWPRITERRRWWTDGLVLDSPVRRSRRRG